MFAEVVAEVVDKTVRAARGRTLALFTSYRVLDVAYLYLMQQRDLPYRILKQGDMPRTKLIDEFRRDVSSVLLGTTSFWEGIDVQGESLSAVVIDRLPFEHPDDPVFEAICERNPRGWFMQYSLPKSIIEFRQGFGRLIRSRTDRGAIVVCDRRIVDKPYGVKYVRSLPEGVRLHRALDVVAKMLGGAI
jgi:ATP-dependent DNA helicase DinG